MKVRKKEEDWRRGRGMNDGKAKMMSKKIVRERSEEMFG
jgi:hypothetical protein